jgi:hypothetical protein
MQNKKVIIPLLIALIVVSGTLIMTQIQLPRDRYNHTTQDRPQNTNPYIVTSEQPRYEAKPTDKIVRYAGILRQASLTADGPEGGIYYQINNEVVHIPYETSWYDEAQKYIQCNILMTITYTLPYYNVINVEITLI